MSGKCTVRYYISPRGENPVKEFLESISKKQKSKTFRIFQLFQEYGLNSITPHVKKLTGTPLWEIRILGRDNIRIIYFIPHKDNILVLHGFFKKSQKTPERELNLALKRYKDWLSRGC